MPRELDQLTRHRGEVRDRRGLRLERAQLERRLPERRLYERERLARDVALRERGERRGGAGRIPRSDGRVVRLGRAPLAQRLGERTRREVLRELDASLARRRADLAQELVESIEPIVLAHVVRSP
jgi:hypothetical protein